MIHAGAVPPLDWGDRYFRLLATALAAFAIAGKGFAYLGVAPLYITEVVLGLGLLVMLQTRCMLASVLSPPALILAALIVLTLARTLPFLPTHGIDALRDSVLVMYGLFTFIVAALLLQRPERLTDVMRFLRWFTGMFVFVGPAIYVINNASGVAPLPTLPGTEINVLSVRAGELGVHLSACAVLALLGLRRASTLWICALIFGILLVGSQNRGGLLAILIPVCFALPFTKVWRKVVVIGLAAVMALGVGYALDLEVPSRGKEARVIGERPLGARQVVDNMLSLVVQSENRQLDDTKMFRVLWWKRIGEYTVGGRLFWTGKGFGVNLAVDDGFVVGDKNSAPLRSPHNSHLNVLARTGVPGMVLWFGLMVAWLFTMMAGALFAWQHGDEKWGNLMLFTACYWLANVINASFDVALEAPMLGVWFWCQTGFGLAVVAIYRAAVEMPKPRAVVPGTPPGKAAWPIAGY